MYGEDEAAARFGITVAELWRRVHAGQFAVPSRLAGRTRSPRWTEADLALSGKEVLARWAAQTRDQYVLKMRDECLLWIMAHPETAGDIPESALGRPQFGGAPYPLGSRVSYLRQVYRQGRLPASDAASFEALPGWAWDHWDHNWRRRFRAVRSRWPHKLTDQDRRWLEVQRAGRDSLRPEWQDELEKVPGLLDPQVKSKVPAFVEACRQWLEANPGKTIADVDYKTDVVTPVGVVNLGKRITYYRRRYRGLEGASRKPLPPDEVAALEGLPGWSWEYARRSHVND